MIVVPDNGSRRIAFFLAPKFTTEMLEVRLYQNDYFPTLLSTLADFQECTFPGYTRHVPNLWAYVGIEAEVHRVIRANAGVWRATQEVSPPQRVFGYYVYHVQSGDVLWAERLPQRFTMRNADTPLTFRLSFGLLSEFSG